MKFLIFRGGLRRNARRARFARAAGLLAAALLIGAPAWTAAEEPLEGEALLDFRQVIRQAKDRVFPTVVFIRCVRENLEQGRRVAESVSGSGVLISSGGEVLSNWHVIDKATEVRCLLYDGAGVAARVVGSDKDTDLALLQLELPEGAPPLPFAQFGDSEAIQEGDFVMAMGAPWGLTRSVSIGIVSCARRFLPENSEYSLWLQTDAAISPGNSGGPLIDTDGRLVGINTRASMAGGDTGFAIPSRVVADLIGQFRRHGKVDWSWTGLQLQPLKDFDRNIYFDATNGVMVAETDSLSPAREAGVRAGDRIVEINGEPVTALTDEDLPAVRRRLGLLPKAEASELRLARGDEEIAVSIHPRAKGEVEGEELEFPRWDLTLKAINQFDNPGLHFYRPEGVFVFGVEYPGNAQRAGLMPQDILLRVDGAEVKTLDEAEAAHEKSIKNLDQKPRLVLTVLRNGLMRQIVLDISRDFNRR